MGWIGRGEATQFRRLAGQWLRAHQPRRSAKMTKILSLQGRASRSEWWIITITGGVVAQIAYSIALISGFQQSGPKWMVFALAVVVGLAALWATFAVTARRFRERGDSPWMALLLIVPALGEIWVMIVCGFLPNPNQPKKRLVVTSVKNGCTNEDAEQVVDGEPPEAPQPPR